MLNSYLSLFTADVAANRPTAPDLPTASPATSALYFATDTGAVSFWNKTTNTWVELAASAGSISTGLTASTTQTLAGALQLTSSYNNVTTVGTAADAVKLPAAVKGAQVWVTNSAAANSMGIFPQAATDIIDGGSAGAKVNCAVTKSALFTCIANGVWQSIGSPARSA